jgi:hypothetical protein
MVLTYRSTTPESRTVIEQQPDGRKRVAVATRSAGSTQHWDLKVTHPSGEFYNGTFNGDAPTLFWLSARCWQKQRTSSAPTPLATISRARSLTITTGRSRATRRSGRYLGEDETAMSRLDRLKEYSNPRHGPQGAGRDHKNLDYWSGRAEANSEIAPRASDGPMHLPSTKMSLRDTEMGPKVSRKVDARARAMADTNVSGGSAYLRGIRRNA